MFKKREEIPREITEIVEKFRAKEATSPEKAIFVDELALSPKSEQALNKWLGQTGIFVRVNGKYFLSEERLTVIREKMAPHERR